MYLCVFVCLFLGSASILTCHCYFLIAITSISSLVSGILSSSSRQQLLSSLVLLSSPLSISSENKKKAMKKRRSKNSCLFAENGADSRRLKKQWTRCYQSWKAWNYCNALFEVKHGCVSCDKCTSKQSGCRAARAASPVMAFSLCMLCTCWYHLPVAAMPLKSSTWLPM